MARITPGIESPNFVCIRDTIATIRNHKHLPFPQLSSHYMSADSPNTHSPPMANLTCLTTLHFNLILANFQKLNLKVPDLLSISIRDTPRTHVLTREQSNMDILITLSLDLPIPEMGVTINVMTNRFHLAIRDPRSHVNPGFRRNHNFWIWMRR